MGNNIPDVRLLPKRQEFTNFSVFFFIQPCVFLIYFKLKVVDVYFNVNKMLSWVRVSSKRITDTDRRLLLPSSQLGSTDSNRPGILDVIRKPGNILSHGLRRI